MNQSFPKIDETKFQELNPMTTQAYETPSLKQVGDFHLDTGEFIGPYDEAILPLEDHSNEG